MIRTPRSSAPLWLASVLVYALWPFAQVGYFEDLLQTGTLPPDGDSIGIPIGGGFILTALSSPLLILALWLILRNYRGSSPVPGRPTDPQGRFWTIMLGLVGLIVAWTSAETVREGLGLRLLVPQGGAALLLLPFLQAAAVDR